MDAKQWAALSAAALLASAGVLGCQSTAESRQVADDSEWRDGGPHPAERSTASTESAPVLETVYFSFDEWSLNPRTREQLQKNAHEIADHEEWGRVTVEGHCDERGSEEYNLLLGQRRATEVVSYLRDLGVPAARLKTVSFGESRPAVVGYTEAAYRLNRRSVFLAESRTAAR